MGGSRGVVVATAAAAFVLLIIGGLIVAGLQSGRFPLWWGDPRCVATVDDHAAGLDPDDAAIAGVIAGTSVGSELPPRAASIALTVAYADDFDIEDGHEWALEFYNDLAEVNGYTDMKIADAAAEATGRLPDEFTEHSTDARTFASALTGHSRHALTCRIPGGAPEVSDKLNADGLVKRADRLRADVRSVYGDLWFGGFSPGGVSTGHKDGSAHYEGRAVDIFFRPVNDRNKTHGWSVAQYIVTQAERLKVQTVIFDAQIWTADRSNEGWRDYTPPARSGSRLILEHRDHVHADVYD